MRVIDRNRLGARLQRGYLLLAVSLGLIVLSMFAFTAFEIGQGEAQLRATNASASNARYAAQAGVAKAQWQLAQNGVCNGYQGSTITFFDEFKVKSTISPASGSPVSITSLATNAAGVLVQVQRDVMPVMRAPETVVITPGARLADTYVKGDKPDEKQGSKKDIKVGVAKPQISLMRFDLLEVPQGVQVLGATLDLSYKSAAMVDPGGLLSVFAMQQPWEELNATFNEDGLGNAWSWPDAYDGSDRIEALDLSAEATGRVEFDVTRLVRAWVSGERENFGLAIAALDGVVTDVKFRSSDDNLANNHPKLTVTYACECGVVCALGGESLDVLMFVDNQFTPAGEDLERLEWLQSMGHSVTMIDDDQLDFVISLLVANSSVAYISSTVDASALLGDLASLPIGIVSENAPLLQEIGFADAFSVDGQDGIRITDTGHYVTSGLIANAVVQLTEDDWDYHFLQGTIASGAQLLGAESSGAAAPSLAVLESGGTREDGTLSIARRVNLPWAGVDANFDISNLTLAGRQILLRSLEWASGGSGIYPDYYDNFAYQTCSVDPDYVGSVGENDWSGQAWTENVGDGFSCTGTIRIATDPDIPDGANKRLLFAGAGEISREVDLTGYATAFVGLEFRREGTALINEELRLYASIDGAFYTLLGTIPGGITDAVYLGVFADITAYISANTHIKVEGVGLSETARFYLDNISVSLTQP